MNKFLLLLLAVAATACGQGGKLTLEAGGQPNRDPQSKSAAVEGAEFVNGSALQQTSILNGYKVQHSVGDIISKISTTSPTGYKLYSTVQGDIISTE